MHTDSTVVRMGQGKSRLSRAFLLQAGEGKGGNWELRKNSQREKRFPPQGRPGPTGVCQECEVAVTSKSSEVQNSPKNTIYFLSIKCVSGPVLDAEDIVLSNKA